MCGHNIIYLGHVSCTIYIEDITLVVISYESYQTSTHNLCFGAKIRKKVYPCKLQFYCIKVGCKGVFITRTRFRDVKEIDKLCISTCLQLFCDLYLIYL